MADRPQSDDHDDAGRAVARGELDLRCLGCAARSAARDSPTVPRLLWGATPAGPCFADHPGNGSPRRLHILRRLPVLGLLPGPDVSRCPDDPASPFQAVRGHGPAAGGTLAGI